MPSWTGARRMSRSRRAIAFSSTNGCSERLGAPAVEGVAEREEQAEARRRHAQHGARVTVGAGPRERQAGAGAELEAEARARGRAIARTREPFRGEIAIPRRADGR